MAKHLRKILLLAMALTLGYLLWAIALLNHQNGHRLFVSSQFKKADQAQLYALEKQYAITHLKRIIADEHRALLESQLMIAQILKDHPDLPYLSLGTTWPSAHVAELLSTPMPTKKPVSSLAIAKHASLVKDPLSPDPKKHLLALSPQETKSFQSLKHFIAEKRQGKPLSLTEDEKQLLAMPPQHYTIQVFGARTPEALHDFVTHYHLINTKIFHSYYLNRPWFTLVLGKYKTYNNALAVLKTLPKMNEEPWIRPLSSLQAAIKLYR